MIPNYLHSSLVTDRYRQDPASFPTLVLFGAFVSSSLFGFSCLPLFSSWVHRVQDFEPKLDKDASYKTTSRNSESNTQGNSRPLLNQALRYSNCFFFFSLSLSFFPSLSLSLSSDLSNLSFYFYLLLLVSPYGFWNAAEDVWFNMNYIALVKKYFAHEYRLPHALHAALSNFSHHFHTLLTLYICDIYVFYFWIWGPKTTKNSNHFTTIKCSHLQDNEKWPW